MTLNDNYNGGPIQISITADGNTQMKCDVPTGCGTRTDGLTDTTNPTGIDFAEWYKPTALTMTALIPDAQANETLSVSVTPFTHMAAARAEAASTLDAAAIANANSEVSNLLNGIDILNTPPVDISDDTAVSGALSATQVTYAALASALSNQGFVDANGQPDLNAAIDLLASSFVTGIIEADDTNGDDAAQISLQEIVTAAEETFTAAGIIDLTGILDGLQSAIDYAEDDGDGTIDPVPSTTAADPDLDKVKAMVSDIRTWGNVIVAETEVRGSAFETQVSLASDAIGIFGTHDPIDVLDACLEAALSFTSGTTNIADYDLGLNTFDSGTIDSASGVITITDGVVHGYTVNITLNMPADGTSDTSFSLDISSATISSLNNVNVMTINNGVANVTFAEPFTVVYADIADPLVPVVLPVTTDLTFDLDNIAFTQYVDSSGNLLASPVTFEGVLSTDLDPIPVINDPLNTLDDDEAALPKTLSLSGVISNTLGDSVTATLAVNVTNTATFQIVGDFAPVNTLYSVNHIEPFATWAYTDEDATSGVDTFTASNPGGSLAVYWNATDGSITQTITYSDGFSYTSTFGFYNSLFEYLVTFPLGDIYAFVDGEGLYFADVSLADFSKDGTLDGKLIDPEYIVEAVDSWIDADIGLTFVVQLDGLPEARINITADRTGFEAGEGQVTVSYDNRQLALSATVGNSQIDGLLTITNQDNVVLNLDFTETDVTLLTGTLSYNGVKYADVEETTSGYLKVSYIDGTFEIF